MKKTVISGKLAVNDGNPVRSEPFPDWPVFDKEEKKALIDVLESGKWWRFAYASGVELNEPEEGEKSNAIIFQEEFAKFHQCKYGIAAANGTATLEIGLRAMGLNIGDEVIVPAYTFVASATCVLQNNCVPIFVDIDPDTYNISPEKVEQAITDRTRAIIVVHFGGQLADMDKLMQISKKYNIPIIEDAAHAHGCQWKDQMAGSFGLFSSFSFQAKKNMTSGEGGIICTNNEDIATKCDSLIWSGRKVGRPWYEFHQLGWNYRITEFQAAILRVQLKRLDSQIRVREKNAQYLTENLSKIDGVAPLIQDERTTLHGYHIYMFRYDENSTGLPRSKFLAALNAEGVTASGGYAFPLYKNPMFINKKFINGSFPLDTKYHEDIDYSEFAEKCPVSERACDYEAVWIPQNLFLGTKDDMDDIAEAVEKVLKHKDQVL